MRFDEDEDSRAGVNQNLEEVVDVPIEIRPLVEDRIGMVLPPQAARSAARATVSATCTRFAGTRPAQAG